MLMMAGKARGAKQRVNRKHCNGKMIHGEEIWFSFGRRSNRYQRNTNLDTK